MTDAPRPVATRSDWPTGPVPVEQVALPLAAEYDLADFERIKAGLLPEEMEDKWFMFFEAPWLYVHESWTGYCIFGARFEPSPHGAAIVESWASRDREQWHSENEEFDARFLKFLIDAFLLGKQVPFPAKASAVAQHMLTGRVFPEGDE